MRWRRTVVIWLVVMTLFSVYNLLPVVLAPTIPPSISQDPKVLTYNFTMDQPSSVQDNFTTHVTLENNPSFYNVRASVYDWFYIQSYSAFGEYQLNYSIYINGVNVLSAYFANVWDQKNYLLSGQGPFPDLPVHENTTYLQMGVNAFEFRFLFFSKLSKYGSGYYYLKLGPFSVDLSGRPTSIFGPLALEVLGGVLLVPASYVVLLTTYAVRRRMEKRPVGRHNTDIQPLRLPPNHSI